jgi:hypothetical protein
LLFDALSFLVSALALALVRGSFNTTDGAEKTLTSLREDVVEGLRYVLSHPVLRNISIMMALINFLAATTQTRLPSASLARFVCIGVRCNPILSGDGQGSNVATHP